MNNFASQKIAQAKTITTGLYADIKTHWKTPGKDRFVAYKEILNYGIGGMGRDMLIYFISFMALNAGNTLLGSTIHIRPMHLQTIQMSITLFGLVWLFVRGTIMDNVRSKWGKFRPLIAVTGIPLAVLTTWFVFIDFDTMMYSKKLLYVIVFAVSIELIKPFIHESFIGLGQVITPNASERAGIVTIYSLMYSIAPSIYGFLVPFLSQFTGGLTNIRTYRLIVVPIGLLGVGLTFFAAFGCKERTIVSQNYVQKVNVLKGMRYVFRNKYWWIRNTANWVMFMEDACKNIFAWMFIYGVQDMTVYSITGSIIGESALIAMLLTPVLLSKIGNQRLVLLHNGSNIVFLFGMFLTRNTPALFVMFLLLNSLVNYFTLIYNPVLDGEVKDYQHYICGKRVDGCFTAASVINIPISLATGFAIPFLYECFGLTLNYDILYDAHVRKTMFTILLGVSIVGAIINMTPYFFYDYTREKHASIIRVIRLRAMIEDFIDGKLEPVMIKRGIEDYHKVKEIKESPEEDIKSLKSALRAAKRGDKAEYKAIRTRYLKARQINEEKKYINLYEEEFKKFDEPQNAMRLYFVQAVWDKGYDYLIELSQKSTSEISLLISRTAEKYGLDKGRRNRSFVNKYQKRALKFLRMIRKYYGKEIVEGDQAAIQRAAAMPRESISEAKARRALLKQEIQKMKRYNKVMDFYLEEKRLVKQHNGLLHFQEIEEMYEDAAAKVEMDEQRRFEKEMQAKREKKEREEKIKQEKFFRMSPKKQEKVLARRKKRAFKKQQKKSGDTEDCA